MASDGKIIIDIELVYDKVKDGIKNLKNVFSDLGGIGNVFGELSSLTDTFSNTFKSLSGVVGPVAAGVVAGIITIATAFNKLYDASKQNFFENLENVKEKLQPVVDIVNNATSEILDCFSEVTGFSFDFSTLIAEAIEFESSMSRVSAIMGVVGKDMELLQATTRQYGASTRYTSTQVAEAFGYMGMAGFTLNESLDSIQKVLDLTTIGSTELGTASDIVTDGLTALNMSASQASNFVDYMAATITRSNTDVELMGETLKYAGSVAGTLGVSMDDLAVAIGLMANSSVKGSRSGTALRTLMANLSAPTETVAKAMQQYGIELITAEDGSVDLDKTLRSLRKSLKSLPLVEQAAACKNLAGKTGMTGLLAIVNATDEAYESLTSNVQNSTQTVSYWNENLGQMGITGEKCSKRIELLKDVLKETEYLGAAFNMTTQDMALALQVLSSDAKLTTKNVKDLFSVLDAMKNPSKKQSEIFEQLGLTFKEINDDAFNYSATCDMINSNTVGIIENAEELNGILSKQDIIDKLSPDMTLEEANEILKEYGLSAKTASTGQIDFIANLKNLRDTFKNMDYDTRNATLSNLGLSNSINEISEICNLSDEEFEMYCKNLEEVTGLSEKMAKAMDLTTKNSLLVVASALQDVAINGFELLKPSIVAAADALTEFFTIFRSGNKEGSVENNQSLYTFENFKLALDNMLEHIRNADFSGAISSAVSKVNVFVQEGGLSRILAIGTEIIKQICEGIIKSEDELNKAISSAIKQIANFVKENANLIKEAGTVILKAILNGLEENAQEVHDALDGVTAAMDDWVKHSEKIKSFTGNFADVFISSFIENLIDKSIGKATEIWKAIMSFGTYGKPDFTKGFTGIINKIVGWFTGESYAAEIDKSSTSSSSNKTTTTSTSNKISSTLSNLNTTEIKNLQMELSNLSKTVETISNSIAQNFNAIQNSARTSFLGCANIVRNQFISISNIVKNQSTSARNSFTSQMISIRKVANTQITLTRNTITSQMISIRKVVNTQSTLARNSFTSQMISMKKVAQTQSRETGLAISNGFALGIRNGTRDAVNAAKIMVQQVNAEIRKTAKINSPSEETTTYGEYEVEGLIQGFKNKAKELYSVARNITTEMHNQMKLAVASESTNFAVNANTTAELKVMSSSNKVSTKINDLISTMENTTEALKNRPIQTQVMIEKEKMATVLHESIKEKSNEKDKRLNRLEGVYV